MKKKTLLASVFVASTVTLGFSSVANAATMSTTVSEEEFERQLLAHVQENPADVEGFTDLATSLGGDVESTSSTLRTDEVPGLAQRLNLPQGFPQDVFTVNLVVGSVGNAKIVTGSFDWRDDFVGQADPLDIAALRFSSGCGEMTNLVTSTRNPRGEETGRSWLREAGVGTNAPIWNVDATTSGFENQADQGAFGVTYDVSNCGGTAVQAAFDHEGNQGGSLVSVSAGWGGLSISYNNPGLTLKKSTQPLTLN